MKSLYGITSTYVENTLLAACLAVAARDHLHIRGEHDNFAWYVKGGSGSPPHTWRTLIW